MKCIGDIIKNCTKTLQVQPSSKQELPAQFTENSIAELLYEKLSYSPICGNEKAAKERLEKSKATRYPYIVINQPSQIYWITFDLDHANTWIWQDVGLPMPNFIVRDRQTGRGHITYAIEPVCISKQGRINIVQYLSSIRRTMNRLLDADKAYNNRVTKNPFHDRWLTTWLHDQQYTLTELHEHLGSLDSPEYYQAQELIDPTQRNCSVFHSTRLWSYSAVHHFRERKSYEEWQETVSKKVSYYASMTTCPTRGILGANEQKSIAKSIASWCWHHYQGNSHYRKLQLDPSLPLQERQKQGARYTHLTRKAKTEQLIKKAIEELRSTNQKLTKSKVAKIAGISRQHISTHYKHLFEVSQVHPSNAQPLDNQNDEFNTSDDIFKKEKSVSFAQHQVIEVLKKPPQNKPEKDSNRHSTSIRPRKNNIKQGLDEVDSFFNTPEMENIESLFNRYKPNSKLQDKRREVTPSSTTKTKTNETPKNSQTANMTLSKKSRFERHYELKRIILRTFDEFSKLHSTDLPLNLLTQLSIVNWIQEQHLDDSEVTRLCLAIASHSYLYPAKTNSIEYWREYMLDRIRYSKSHDYLSA